ncbi:MAG: carboxypeptidase M32 [Candidatus Woesearchaeota archaeon]
MKKEKKLPPEFVEELSRVTSQAYIAWKKAKQTNNFKLFEPHLKKVIDLKRKEAKLRGIPGHPYNSLLDCYEEGMRVEKLKKTFDYLKKELVPLIRSIQATKTYKEQDRIIPPRNVPKQVQEEIGKFISQKLGLKLGKESRLDETEHPFTSTLGIKDTRITTNYKEGFPESFFSTIHETGHALYSLGVPAEYGYTVVGEGSSLGMHESQSRFYENVIGRNPVFWEFMLPHLKKYKELKKYSLKEWQLLANKVRPSFIRVQADEVTYNLHVIIRFELELALLEGKLEAKDLPRAWNQKVKEYLGITPKTNKEGVLQDVHWSLGLIGYFPTYALGNIYSAQLYNEMLKDNPDIISEMRKGKFDSILNWLTKKVYVYGRTITTEEIIKNACGRGLDPKAFINYLREKYSKIYWF